MEVGIFEAPQLYDGAGNQIPAALKVSDNLLLVVQSGTQNRSACGKATAGKWTYRIGAAGVCGALAAGTGGVTGAACGLGASAAEDHINFDSVC